MLPTELHPTLHPTHPLHPSTLKPLILYFKYNINPTNPPPPRDPPTAPPTSTLLDLVTRAVLRGLSTREPSREEATAALVAVLRSAGAFVRTVWSLEPIPLRRSANEMLFDGMTKRLRRHFHGIPPGKSAT